jgi:hypothetical protein
MEEDIRYEVHIQSPGIVRGFHYTLVDLSTGQSYHNCLPDYIKQKPVEELNAHTRFVRDVETYEDGEYKFNISWYDGEMFVDFEKSGYQLQKDFFDSLTGILW